MSEAQFLSYYLGLVKRPVKMTATLASEVSCDFKWKKKSVFFKVDKLTFFGVASPDNFAFEKKKTLSDVSFMSQWESMFMIKAEAW